MTLRTKSLTFGLAAAALFLSAGVSLAQENSCQTDFQKLSARRMDQMQRINAIAKAGKGKMDPVAACPAARALSAADTEMLNFMLKNKEWCQIPDNIVESFKASRAKSVTLASQACAAAAQFKKMQAEGQAQAAAQAPKLPAGPL